MRTFRFEVGPLAVIFALLFHVTLGSKAENDNENRLSTKREESLKRTADYFNKLTRHPRVAKAVLASRFEPGSDASTVTKLYRKKCPGESQIVVPDAGQPQRIHPRKHFCGVELPANAVPREADGSDSELKKGNQHSLVCVCQ